MAVSLYDTAWLSMVKKWAGGETQDWLSPESFQYILDTQDLDGGWHSTSFPIDGILSTLAALLALCKHVAPSEDLARDKREQLYHRRNRAIYYLDETLAQWDVTSTTSPGFEILVPKLLELLSAEGIDFNFAGLLTLHDLRARSSTHFDPAALYAVARSSTAQYLEAFIGDIDFNKMSQHKISGSIMASPAATSAYLIHGAIWDDDCEEYLRHLLTLKPDGQHGAVPSQYPTTVFEVTECLCALTSSGLSAEQLGSDLLSDFADFLEACLAIDGGTCGSAPYMESDADSTAKVISTLCQLGRTPSPHGMIIRFEMRDSFKTLTHERRPQLRTNCLVLKALLDLARKGYEHNVQINKAANFIIDEWGTINGEIYDSSNLARNYPLMLLADALCSLLDYWNMGTASTPESNAVQERLDVCLYQVLIRTLQAQNPDGSWGWSTTCENTAFAVLTLTKLAAFTSAPRVRIQLTQAVDSAKEFLESHYTGTKPEYLWCGKTIGASKKITEAYVLAALEAYPTKSAVKPVETRYDMSLSRMAIQTKYFARQAWFTMMSEWQIQACLVESHLFLPRLRGLQQFIFPADKCPQSQYFEVIPFMWLAANEFYRRMIGPEYLYQMMALTILNRQFNSYVKDHVVETFNGCLFEVEDVIHHVFDQLQMGDSKGLTPISVSHGTSRTSTSTTATTATNELYSVFGRFVDCIINNRYVKLASDGDQATLVSELFAFMRSQIYNLANQAESPQLRRTFTGEKVHEARTHHGYTFAFLTCIVGNQRILAGTEKQIDFLESPEQKYLADAMCHHMSTVDSLASKAPTSPSPSRQLSPPMHSRSRFGSHQRAHNSSVSSFSTATSSSVSAGRVSPASFMSSNSSVPAISPLSDHFSGRLNKEPPQAAEDVYQNLRLLNHERRCLEVCIQDLVAAGINQRTASIIGLYSDIGELSAQIFNDPNVGSYYQPNGVNEIIEQVEAFQLSEYRPLKSARRGSVSRARANLSLEPARPKHITIHKKAASFDETTSRADVAVMPLSPKSQPPPTPNTSLTSTQPITESRLPSSAPAHMSNFDFNFPPAMAPLQAARSRSPSNSSLEMSRIQEVMTKLGEGELKRTKRHTPVVHDTAPHLKAERKLQEARARQASLGATALSIHNVSTHNGGQALKRISSTPALSRIESNATRKAKARLQTQRSIRDQLDRELEHDRQLRNHERKVRALKNSITFPTPCTEAAAPSLSAPPTPRLVKKKKATTQKVRFQIDEKEQRRLQAQGWIKAPSAESVTIFLDMESDAGDARRSRLTRGRKASGPKLKLPF